MKKETTQKVFKTDKRIKLGIWGLGRGMAFYKTCKFLNIDVVAGCDYNEDLRTSFLNANPGAFATADADEFLKQDFDAVLLATFCPAHADDAIKCLRAGKHVLSEVTAFFTMAEGVRLVEEVEKRKLVYNLVENYPFSAENMWLANRWKEGLFGDLVYAEYEYVHEVRSLCYTYLNGLPVQPGHTVHSWRSWMNYHYYCTHSLGPIMLITGGRPTMVEAFPIRNRLAGYLDLKGNQGLSTMAPSLISMDNGGVVRNLMGASTSDTHHQRIWGTLGAFEREGKFVNLRLGGAGYSPKMQVVPKWEGLGELAATTGHGGGDFWILYYFAREIFTGEKAPFDIYSACDVTIPGIQAYRSSMEGGKPMEVPDFRKKADRDRYRSDDWQTERYDTGKGVFAGAKLNDKAAKFTTIMKNLLPSSLAYRAYADWKKVHSAMSKPEEFLPIATNLLDCYGTVVEAYKEARSILNAYPKTDGAKAISEMLELGEENKVLSAGFLPALKKEVASLRKKFGYGSSQVTEFTASELIKEKTKIASIKYPKDIPMLARLPYRNFDGTNKFSDIRSQYEGHSKLDGVIFARGIFVAEKASSAKVEVGADSPFKVFINGKAGGCNPKANDSTSMKKQSISASVKLKKGANEIIVAIRTNDGKALGFRTEVILGK
ncbi:MAG TPA: Gfo/Idh/MocA family oxidoreductase [Victivallales bacterium]|nr:Gfo/Idh/MocA family oxidoreductase [Victivallales bacterium]